jgi:hypothetical protein
MTETQTPTFIPVLPPENAQSANDLWDIELPAEIERANERTHGFGGEDGRCGGCDCRGGGAWSRFACDAGTPGAMTFADFLENGPRERQLGDRAVGVGGVPVVWVGKTDMWSSGWEVADA